MKVALVQMTSTDVPPDNLAAARELIREGAGRGAKFILTPEVMNCVSSDRALLARVLATEEGDATLSALRDEANALGIWLLIGSLGLRTGEADGRFANRSFLVAPDGSVAARYDKIHMFDVDISATESYRESAGYRPGSQAIIAATPFGRVGMSVCYDVRFPHLYRRLAQAGATILTIPAAFNDTTGAAHWETLVRARAIETGCFVLAPTQTGTHGLHSNGRPRRTWGHSLAVAPWGEVLADGGTDPGVTLADLDLSLVGNARARVPSLLHDRPFGGP
ncbi:MAG: carbon-nitrogen hydrolase family protein [Paracoccaceae bacterium]